MSRREAEILGDSAAEWDTAVPGGGEDVKEEEATHSPPVKSLDNRGKKPGRRRCATRRRGKVSRAAAACPGAGRRTGDHNTLGSEKWLPVKTEREDSTDSPRPKLCSARSDAGEASVPIEAASTRSKSGEAGGSMPDKTRHRDLRRRRRLNPARRSAGAERVAVKEEEMEESGLGDLGDGPSMDGRGERGGGVAGSAEIEVVVEEDDGEGHSAASTFPGISAAAAAGSKRKRVVLTIEQKFQILSRLGRGDGRERIASDFGIGKSTVTSIKKAEASLRSFVGSPGSFTRCLQRKIMRGAQDRRLDGAVFAWFALRRGQGLPLSGPIVSGKAKQLNRQLGGDPDFKASTGWLKRFQQRHGIRRLCPSGGAGDRPAATALAETEAVQDDGWATHGDGAGYSILADEDIDALVTESREAGRVRSEDGGGDGGGGANGGDDFERPGVTHLQAEDCFRRGLDWLRRQPEAEAAHLASLRSLVRLAAEKRAVEGKAGRR